MKDPSSGAFAVTQRNLDEAATAAGVSPNTLLSWMKIPEFRTAYRDARRQAFGQSIARLQQATSAAATTLMKISWHLSLPRGIAARRSNCRSP